MPKLERNAMASVSGPIWFCIKSAVRICAYCKNFASGLY